MYEPAEDSYLFKEFLEKNLIKNKDVEFLDMGTGSTILSQTAKKRGIKKITSVDINPNAVKIAKEKGFNAIKSTLFQKIPKDKKYDIICFNAPYLPQDKREPVGSKQATTGGKRGDEISLKFIKQAKQHLTPTGKIYLLISTLTPFNRIKKYKPKIVKRKKIFFEELLILEL